MSVINRFRALTGPSTLPVTDSYGDPAAARLIAALRARSWPDAQQALAAASDAEHLSLLLGTAIDVKGLESWLPDILRAELDATLPSLVYGARMIGWAWDARSTMRAQYVSRDQFDLFYQRLRMAEDCLQGVVRREPGNVGAWHLLLITARGLQLGVPEAQRRFEQAITHHPGHVRAHQQMLQMLCAKWFGSHEQMHEFARTAMENAPPGSPLGHLVADAYVEEALDRATGASYVRSMKRHMRTRAVRAALHEAADRSVRHPDYRSGSAWTTVHGAFAFAFSLAGEHRAAAEQFRILGDVVTESPWAYVDGDAGRGYCRLRKLAYARA